LAIEISFVAYEFSQEGWDSKECVNACWQQPTNGVTCCKCLCKQEKESVDEEKEVTSHRITYHKAKALMAYS